MKIKVLKTQIASKDKTGCFSFKYEAGNIYDIYEELAKVFIDNGWGERIENSSSEQKTLAVETTELPEVENLALTNEKKKGRKKKAQ